MSEFPTAAGSFATAAVASLAATPVAMRVAWRTGFLDRPRGYRQHSAATPFLGGAAVLLALLAAGIGVGQVDAKLRELLVCAVALWLLGTLDDWRDIAPRWRVLAEVGAATFLFATHHGWITGLSGPVDLALTIVWLVAVVNAFNLMDNLDGACATVTAVATGGIGAFAAVRGQVGLSVLAFSVAGAYAGFLPWNLTRRAKIFLGDGGSMLAGFLVAALAMAVARHAAAGNAGILVGALLAGLPLFDAALVSFSRTRRNVPLSTGGRDHLTHRLLLVLSTPRRVAVVLAAAQAGLSAIAVLGYELGTAGVALLALGVFLMGLAGIVVLDTTRWRPAGIAYGPPRTQTDTARSEASGVGTESVSFH